MSSLWFLGSKGKLGLLAVQAVQGVLLVVLPHRHVLVQDVGDAHPERVPGGQALLGVRRELVYLRPYGRDLVHYRLGSVLVPRLLRIGYAPGGLVPPAPELVHVVLGLPPLLVQPDDLVDAVVGDPPPVVIGPDRVGVLPEHRHV